MSAKHSPDLGRVAVIGAGNMGSGIAQKMATEGLAVTLVDLDDEKVARGLDGIRRTLEQGVERKVLRPDEPERILGRIRGTSDWGALAGVGLAVEAVFEDAEVKRDVFRKLDDACGPEAILATNTSSFSVRELAEATRRPERVLGLHYFYHPAKNRLVEVIPGARTDARLLRAAWALQEQIGKTPIASADVHGFVVNRYFVPWLNEAVRLLEEGVASIPTIEAACKSAFGAGLGPFELMNVTGVPIALHAATTLGRVFGPFYAPAARLARQVESGEAWPLDGAVDAAATEAVTRRMLAVVFHVAAELVDAGVATVEDTDIGARVGLRWPRGPFELMNDGGTREAAALARTLGRRWQLELPQPLAEREASGAPFHFEIVRRKTEGGIATLTINRPDAMNALDEAVVAQLHAGLREAASDSDVRGIVIAGAGKAFIAGADIRFFVRNIEAGSLERIVEFTRAGHALLAEISACPKPVIARVHGLALGGGLELALACRRIVAAPRAALAFPETGIGIYPGLGGTQRLPRRVGAGLAKWLVFTGETIGAEEAREIGLVDEVVPHAELDAAIRRLIVESPVLSRPTWPIDKARLQRFFTTNPVEEIRRGKADTGGDERLLRAMRRVATKAPAALRLAERLIDHAAEGDLDSGLRLELEHLREIFSTADALEGLSSLGRRRPSFKGC